MKIVDGKTGFAAPMVVYTIVPTSWGGTAKILRVLGCAFPGSDDGYLITCNHVIQSILDDELLVVQHPTETIYHKADIIARHDKFDIAFLKIDAKTQFWPMPIMDEQYLATSVWAYGYYDSVIENYAGEITPQIFSGTITAVPKRNLGLLTDLPFYQLSFAALPGFSGSPLYVDMEKGAALCGMLFENRSSKVVVRTTDEYIDGKMHFIEKSVREWESGIAHTTKTIQRAASDLGVPIWK